MNKIYLAKCDKKLSHEFLFDVLHRYYGVKADESGLTRSKYGKLALVDGNLRFNITHSGDMVAVGIGKKELGLDAELVRPRKHEAVAKKYFGVTPATDEEFYTLWTKAESFVKYNAASILAELKKIQIDGDRIIYDGAPQSVKTKTVRVGDYIFSLCSKDLDLEFIDLKEFTK